MENSGYIEQVMEEEEAEETALQSPNKKEQQILSFKAANKRFRSMTKFERFCIIVVVSSMTLWAVSGIIEMWIVLHNKNDKQCRLNPIWKSNSNEQHKLIVHIFTALAAIACGIVSVVLCSTEAVPRFAKQVSKVVFFVWFAFVILTGFLLMKHCYLPERVGTFATVVLFAWVFYTIISGLVAFLLNVFKKSPRSGNWLVRSVITLCAFLLLLPVLNSVWFHQIRDSAMIVAELATTIFITEIAVFFLSAPQIR